MPKKFYRIDSSSHLIGFQMLSKMASEMSGFELLLENDWQQKALAALS